MSVIVIFSDMILIQFLSSLWRSRGGSCCAPAEVTARRSEHASTADKILREARTRVAAQTGNGKQFLLLMGSEVIVT